MTETQNLEHVFHLLACPNPCGHTGLDVHESSASDSDRWQAMLGERRTIPHKLICGACGREYPVTRDGIPVMWSQPLEATFGDLDADMDAAAPTEQNVKAANIQVYENIVDAYDAEGIHADPATQSRMISAVCEATPSGHGPHLDIGCGAGNVLDIFASEFAGLRVGVDVSLSGLRATRRKGHCAVLADAERLPFRAEVAGLITSSSVLHHLYEPHRFISEAQRILRANGVFLTDFDPNGHAARWGRLARLIYDLRRPIYRALSFGRRRVYHGTEQVQTWNAVAEFHNQPDAGFDPDQLRAMLRWTGLDVSRVFLHNCGDPAVSDSRWVRPTLRHSLLQLLSGRNPFVRRNANTVMTTSLKPQRSAAEIRDERLHPAPEIRSGQLDRPPVSSPVEAALESTSS